MQLNLCYPHSLHSEERDNFTFYMILTVTQYLNGLCTQRKMSHTLTTVLLYVTGMLWPLEGMPKFLQQFAHCLPGTDPILSMHDILRRGKSILESQVYRGFLITIVWILFECATCIIILKMKSKTT